MRFMASLDSSGRSHAWLFSNRPLFPIRSCVAVPRRKEAPVAIVARPTKTPRRISGCAHTVPRGFRVLGGCRRPTAQRAPMAVVAQPMQMSHRIVLPGGQRQALASWWRTALAYLLLLVLGYLLLTPLFTW